jgi:hypothetical protein
MIHWLFLCKKLNIANSSLITKNSCLRKSALNFCRKEYQIKFLIATDIKGGPLNTLYFQIQFSNNLSLRNIGEA